MAGNDITLVTWGAMVGRCEAAAKERGGEVGDPVDKYEPLAELEPTTSRSRCPAPEAGVVPPIERAADRVRRSDRGLDG